MLYLLALPLATFFFGGVAIVAAVLRVPFRLGGVYDWCQRTWARTLIRASGTPIRPVHFERVPRDQALVYVGNHQSWFDILALAALLPGSARFVAKKEMRKIPFLGWAMQSAGTIFIDRQHRAAAVGALDETQRLMRMGVSAVLFPEGTRSRTGNLLPFKKGPFVLATAAQVPLQPFYCANTFGILPKGSMKVNPTTIELRFGTPISTVGCTYEDRERLQAECLEAILALRGEGTS
ncbi:MAG: lysophospholipid acyltransferase family protein [Gemmatimonadales bacterium]